MMVLSLFIIDLMGLFFYNKIGSIISIGDLPTTNIIEPKFLSFFLYSQICSLPVHTNDRFSTHNHSHGHQLALQPVKKTRRPLGL